MSTATEVKLLTLLNVSAIKKPRTKDQPGGYRSSPSISRRSSPLESTLNGEKNGSSSKTPVHQHDKKGTPNGKKGKQSGENISAKKRKSVVWGGEVGPSGSTYGQKKQKNSVKGGTTIKGKEKEVEGMVDVEEGGEGDEGHEGESELVGDIEEDENEFNGTSSMFNKPDPQDGVWVKRWALRVGDDNFVLHFGPETELLKTAGKDAVAANQWEMKRGSLRGYGKTVEMAPKGIDPMPENKNRITPFLLESVKTKDADPLVESVLGQLGSYKDLYLHSLDGEADGGEGALFGSHKEAMRKATAVHVLNHVLKTRRRIIRNNEKLAKDPSIDPPRDTSFTRPKVLLLLPLRSLALHYLTTHLFPLAPPGTQIENLKPFTSSFSTPAGVEDPLSTAQAIKEYPIDHLVNFKGNSDDNFRFGIKITRKAWRVVLPPANEAKLLDCDIIIASPLGIRTAAEKEDSTDLLSSLEFVTVDGMDVMQMQNWDHVQFVFENLNRIPDNPHGCDFSRVKPWYLDNQAKYLRQTLLVSRYDSPEGRALFNRHCHNLQGKVRIEKNDYQGVLGSVNQGVKQVFDRLDLNGAKGAEGAVEEVDQRFEHFTKKTIPALLKSAVQRQNTIIVVPSYFDFVRLNNYLRKEDKMSYTAISEYSSNAEISKARTLFFKGKKSFLLVTERFHFYRRYKIRGAKTLVFYSLPDHAQFYSEYMKTPFLPGKNGQGDLVDVDEGEVSSRVLFSRFDVLKLERVVGSSDARRMLSGGEERFEFIL